MTAAAKKFARPNLSAMAEEELHAADNDKDLAVEALVERIEADDVLFHVLLRPALYDLCASAVMGVIGRRHRVIWDETPAARRRRKHARAEAGRRHVFLTLMDFQLPGGKPLGDASYAEIKRASERYLKHAKTTAHEGRWLGLVAEAMEDHPNEIVRKVLSVKQLTKLKTAAISDA